MTKRTLKKGKKIPISVYNEQFLRMGFFQGWNQVYDKSAQLTIPDSKSEQSYYQEGFTAGKKAALKKQRAGKKKTSISKKKK